MGQFCTTTICCQSLPVGSSDIMFLNLLVTTMNHCNFKQAETTRQCVSFPPSS